MSRRRYLLLAFMALSCTEAPQMQLPADVEEHQTAVMDELASVLAGASDSENVCREVHTAVTESFEGGYDEEYLMTNVVSAPGRGTGYVASKSAERRGALYESMLGALTSKAEVCGIMTRTETEASGFLDSLAGTDLQIYWPYSGNWDGVTPPVVTFDHGEDRDWNYGYIMRTGPRGEKELGRVLIDEEYAKRHPVWVVNLNKDRSYVPLTGILEPPSPSDPGKGEIIYSLLLKDFTALKNYDCWLAGASEFFIKVGAIESFTASTEAEMAMFIPNVTDFYVVVRRSEIGVKKEINTILVSDWTPQMTSIAFVIVEDDGGKRESWDAEVVVKVNSKSYGLTVSIPINSRDDIVWRGSLSSRFLFASDASHTKFGDVLLGLEIMETYNNSDW